MDPETRQALQGLVGNELGLPPSLHRRIAGASVTEMRADGRRLAADLGVSAPARDRDGRIAGAGTFSDQIRKAAGR